MNKERKKKTSVDSLEALTDVEIDYPLIHKDDYDALGGRNTTKDRYPITDAEDYE